MIHPKYIREEDLIDLGLHDENQQTGILEERLHLNLNDEAEFDEWINKASKVIQSRKKLGWKDRLAAMIHNINRIKVNEEEEWEEEVVEAPFSPGSKIELTDLMSPPKLKK